MQLLGCSSYVTLSSTLRDVVKDAVAFAISFLSSCWGGMQQVVQIDSADLPKEVKSFASLSTVWSSLVKILTSLPHGKEPHLKLLLPEALFLSTLQHLLTNFSNDLEVLARGDHQRLKVGGSHAPWRFCCTWSADCHTMLAPCICVLFR
ncbi:MAG: hypothetical protein WDW38_011610 [Sanguina aurantia]